VRRGIDHLVHCVHDLKRAQAFYDRLGFSLTPMARHPFGTINSLIQLNGNFLEILALGDPDAIEPPAPGHFSFARHNKRFLADGEGASMLVFEGHDARADQAEFRLKRLDTYDPFDFSRNARLPDGEEVTVGFSLAFVTHPDMPYSAFFTCQQHAPEHFWKPDYQRHDNTAQCIIAVTMVAPDPARYDTFFRALQGTDSVAASAAGLEVATDRGVVRVLTPRAYEERHGAAPPDLGAGPRFAAVTFAVGDLSTAGQLLSRSGIDARIEAERIVIAAGNAFGLLIEFVQA